MDRNTVFNITKATGIGPGEHVLIHFWGEDSDRDAANAFSAAVAALGATPFVLQQSRSANFDLFSTAAEGSFDDAYFEAFARFDTVLDIFAYRPIILDRELPPEKMSLYRRYIKNLFYALMKARRFVQLRLPTAANAEESGLDREDYIRRMNAAYSIDLDALKKRCTQAVRDLSANDRYVIATGENCVLHLDLTGRPWHIDAGDGDWPCGEVYIAPVENAHGRVFFEKLFVEDTGCFENVTLEFADGRLASADHSAVSKFIDALSPADRVLCELGFGMNPNVGDLCGYAVLDEKMCDTFHIAIGANTMFGGKNNSKVHMDFVHTGGFHVSPVQQARE